MTNVGWTAKCIRRAIFSFTSLSRFTHNFQHNLKNIGLPTENSSPTAMFKIGAAYNKM